MGQRLFSLVRSAVFSCGRVGLSRSAAALSYYLVLSLFPALLFACGLIARFHLDLSQLLSSLRPLLPAGVFTLLTDYLSHAANQSAPGLFWAGLFTIALSASAAVRTLFRTLDDLFALPHRRGAGHLFSSVLLALLFPLTIHLSLLVIFTGDWLIHFVERHLPDGMGHTLALASLWQWLRYVLLFGFVLLLVLVLYRFGIPRQTASHRAVLAAALATSLALAGCSVIFSRVISLSARYALVYGSLASLIILLVWLYLCGTVLLLGAVAIRIFSPI